ncbi:MAG: hypothetical protein L0215_17965 [Gemmataceae bacterium]|nr:hypothetical protein [Gemmataceae bacterium]
MSRRKEAFSVFVFLIVVLAWQAQASSAKPPDLPIELSVECELQSPTHGANGWSVPELSAYCMRGSELNLFSEEVVGTSTRLNRLSCTQSNCPMLCDMFLQHFVAGSQRADQQGPERQCPDELNRLDERGWDGVIDESEPPLLRSPNRLKPEEARRQSMLRGTQPLSLVPLMW